ncbi:MAG: hypothetical protein J6V11_01100, partial [Alphaproteobacteria bacterium]|nr:hypothetical protein [Alphaproteobacteria bacterium]
LIGPKKLAPTPSPKTHHIAADYFGARVFIFPNNRVRSKNCCAFYNGNLIFKSHIKTDKPLEEFLMENPIILGDLIQKASWAISYYKSTPNMYQKDMDTLLINMEKIKLIDKTRTIRNIPFIQTMENLRQFLFDTLISHHTNQIASTTEDAKQILKSDKNKIFTMAEQLGYIPDAQKMIKYHNLRDSLAHPDDTKHFGGPQLPDNCAQIKEDFEAILTSLLHGQNIKILPIDTEKAPIPQGTLMQISEMDSFNNVYAYQLIDQLDIVQNSLKIYTLPTRANGKSLTGRKKLEALNTLGVLSQSDIDTLEKATKTRNDFAHGGLSSLPTDELFESNRNVHTVLRNIAQYHQERNQR